MTTPAVYYPKSLPGNLVIEDGYGVLWRVPMRPTGWSNRRVFTGYRVSLTPVPAHEAEIQLRSAGWVPVTPKET